MEMRVEYPKKIYHRDGRIQRVLSIDEHALYAARDGWAESPAGPFQTPRARKRRTIEMSSTETSMTETPGENRVWDEQSESQ